MILVLLCHTPCASGLDLLRGLILVCGHVQAADQETGQVVWNFVPLQWPQMVLQVWAYSIMQ